MLFQQFIFLQGEWLGFGSLWLISWPRAEWKAQLGVKQLPLSFGKGQDWESRTLINNHALYATEASLLVFISQRIRMPQ